jgi:hypothetical protein
MDAVTGLLPGAYEHVVLSWPGSPFRGVDRLAKLTTRGVSYGLLTNIDGVPFHYLELDYATSQVAHGFEARARLARDFLRDTFGREAAAARVVAATDWMADPWSRCSWVVAPPGRHRDRDTLSASVADRIWLAGEANSRPLWGTAGGAWLEGERAAAAAVAVLAARRSRSGFQAARKDDMPRAIQEGQADVGPRSR